MSTCLSPAVSRCNACPPRPARLEHVKVRARARARARVGVRARVRARARARARVRAKVRVRLGFALTPTLMVHPSVSHRERIGHDSIAVPGAVGDLEVGQR